MFSHTPMFIQIRDDEGIYSIDREDLIKYSGRAGLIASGVVMRLLTEAFKDLTPHEVPHRDSIRILSAFPGQGVRDGIEFITRAVTQNRFILDMNAGNELAAISPIGGQMYFEVAIGDQAMAYSYSSKVFNQRWQYEVLKKQTGSIDYQTHADYMSYKYGFLGRLLSDENVFAEKKVISTERFKMLM
ncbi:hypothetical protein KEB67_004562 [Escherichia coli]|uniref:hypothetical protein n=1 Tax=Escherichia coli TaxID=562 RepID=UPI000BE225C3|nr:hypothetical protein [Escherichia coli]EHL5742274.1 hypothetical protein [Escherichia coli]